MLRERSFFPFYKDLGVVFGLVVVRIGFHDTQTLYRVFLLFQMLVKPIAMMTGSVLLRLENSGMKLPF